MEKNIIDADRIIFKDVNEDEYKVINGVNRKKAVSKYIRRMLISIIAVAIISFVCYKIIDGRLDNYALFMFALVAIYNCISWLAMSIKLQTLGVMESYYILLEAKVEDILKGMKSRVIFSCDQGICDMPLVASRRQLRKTNVGDSIVVVKVVTVEGYTLKYLKADEYYNIYNK